jgi:hypothetical protein
MQRDTTNASYYAFGGQGDIKAGGGKVGLFDNEGIPFTRGAWGATACALSLTGDWLMHTGEWLA